ncbi:MAG TPA: hypothetical protein VMP68_07995 [Candidatus Eisenbacteria bacterium]|nr:hypothetical protein [Candidatus Eisenbacteria bacterium]
MKERQSKLESRQFLSGWKEIASYLGKGVRTTQRYERMLGLPVRRPAGKPSSSVIATKAELDAWVKASPIREVFHLRNLQPEYELQANALKTSITQMAQLRDQMLALQQEVRRSVGSLRNRISELQDTLSPRTLQVYSQHDERALERPDWPAKSALTKYPKAS